MHLGHARTALVAWLRTQQAAGSIVMRIEDIDTPRVVAGSADSILLDHDWLGLHWDEGPIFQSERLNRYEEVLNQLRPHLFECTCTRKEWRASSAPHESTPSYPGTCRNRPSHPERNAAWRFRMDAPREFADQLHGPGHPTHDDFIVKRSDGLFAYQLVVVVDDHDSEITEVVRGADLLESTGRQIAIYEALDWTPPQWLHVPLVLGADGARLSKRDKATSIGDYRRAGWSRERLLGVLAASLGLINSPQPISLDELVGLFSIKAISREPVRIDAEVQRAPT